MYYAFFGKGGGGGKTNLTTLKMIHKSQFYTNF